MNSLSAPSSWLIRSAMLILVNSAFGEVGLEPFGAALDINSRYVWRGLAWSDGAVLQPSVWCGFEPVTFTVWGNFVPGQEANQGQFNEVDFFLEVEHSIGQLELTGNLGYYQYPNQTDAPATADFELICSHSLASFDLLLTNSIDFLEYRGAYFGSIGLGHSVELCKVGLYHELSLGWSSSEFNEAYIGLDENSILMINYAASLELDWAGLTLEPHLNLSYLPLESIHEYVDRPFLILIGISISREILPCN